MKCKRVMSMNFIRKLKVNQIIYHLGFQRVLINRIIQKNLIDFNIIIKI